MPKGRAYFEEIEEEGFEIEEEDLEEITEEERKRFEEIAKKNRKWSMLILRGDGRKEGSISYCHPETNDLVVEPIDPKISQKDLDARIAEIRKWQERVWGESPELDPNDDHDSTPSYPRSAVQRYLQAVRNLGTLTYHAHFAFTDDAYKAIYGLKLSEKLKERNIKTSGIEEVEIRRVLTDISDLLSEAGWSVRWEEDVQEYLLIYEYGIVEMVPEDEEGRPIYFDSP